MPPVADLDPGCRRSGAASAAFAIGPLVRRLGWCVLIALAPSIVRAEGWLETIRQDVRSPEPAPASPQPEQRKGHNRHHDRDHDDDSSWHFYGDVPGWLLVYGITSPLWVPLTALGDDWDRELLFQRFPYDQAPGYMDDLLWPGADRWSARLSVEYGGDLDDRGKVGGRLLVSTTPRWGADVQMERLYEQLPGGSHDDLWLGDGNLVFRFAQSQFMLWRAGVGINWLDDPAGSEAGFNFTYGADWFPARPWVLSATLDWGTLGRAELFRFNGTAGVLINRVETYVGYEYLDIDRTHINSLLAGVRIWF
jgi:hypothetical protein